MISGADVPALGGSDYPCPGETIQIECKGERIEKVFSEVQPSLSLDGIFKVPIPVATHVDVTHVMRKVQCRQIAIRLYGSNPVLRFNLPVDGGVLVRGAVVVAKRNQRPNLQL